MKAMLVSLLLLIGFANVGAASAGSLVITNLTQCYWNGNQPNGYPIYIYKMTPPIVYGTSIFQKIGWSPVIQHFNGQTRTWADYSRLATVYDYGSPSTPASFSLAGSQYRNFYSDGTTTIDYFRTVYDIYWQTATGWVAQRVVNTDPSLYSNTTPNVPAGAWCGLR